MGKSPLIRSNIGQSKCFLWTSLFNNGWLSQCKRLHTPGSSRENFTLLWSGEELSTLLKSVQYCDGINLPIKTQWFFQWTSSLQCFEAQFFIRNPKDDLFYFQKYPASTNLGAVMLSLKRNWKGENEDCCDLL